jgi:hypothetical protein
MALKREQILKANDLKTIEVDVPEWGGSVIVRTMTGEARQNFQESINSPKGKLPKNMLESLVVATVVDDSGEPLFEHDDIAELKKKSSIALNRVFEAAAELNGLTDKSIDKISGE